MNGQDDFDGKMLDRKLDHVIGSINADNAPPEGAVEGVIEDVRYHPDGSGDVILRLPDGTTETWLATPAQLAELLGDDAPEGN
jgi:hypothetical protein